jgi:hypothetical protein
MLALSFIAIFDDGTHCFFSREAMWIAMGLGVVIFIISLISDLFLSLYAILFCAFFLQRIVVIYFFPEELDYQRHLQYEQSTFVTAMLFLLGSSISVLLGYLFARKRSIMSSANKTKDDASLSAITIFQRKTSIEELFNYYFYVAFPLVLLRLSLMLFAGVGVTSLAFDRGWALIYRISDLSSSFSVCAFVVILLEKCAPKIRKMAFTIICLNFIVLIVGTSKTSLFMLYVNYLLACVLLRKQVTQRAVLIGVGIFVVTFYVYAPVATMMRSWLVAINSVGIYDATIVFTQAMHSYRADLSHSAFFFMQRLGGFDWLVAFLSCGRDVFPWWVSFSGFMIEIVNSLVPGDLIVVPGYISVSKIMPMMFRGYASLDDFIGHAENMGVFSMAYVYFTIWGAMIFFFIWAYISVKILRSTVSVVIKLLYLTCFVMTLFAGGSLVTSVARFYEALLMILFCYIMMQFNARKAVPRNVIRKQYVSK